MQSAMGAGSHGLLFVTGAPDLTMTVNGGCRVLVQAGQLKLALLAHMPANRSKCSWHS